MLMENVKINTPEAMEHLISILADNGYVVKVVPVYETEEEINKRYHNRVSSLYQPRITHYLVSIIGTAIKPVIE